MLPRRSPVNGDFRTVFTSAVFAVLVLLCYLFFTPVVVPRLFALLNPPVEIYTAAENARHFNSADATAFGPQMKDSDDGTLYRGSRSRGTDLVMWFVGGGFLRTDRRSSFGTINELTAILVEYDIVTFDYPVRFRYTVADALRRSYGVLNAVQRYNGKPYRRVHAVGMSAGVMLIGAFVQNETYDEANRQLAVPRSGVLFRSVVSVCGLLSQSFADRYIDAVFAYYIMRGTPGKRYYGCRNLPKMPKLIVTTAGDFLAFQSREFVDSETGEFHVYPSVGLRHSFALSPRIPETRDLIERVVRFVIENSRTR